MAGTPFTPRRGEMIFKRLSKLLDKSRQALVTRRLSWSYICLGLASRVTYTEILVVLRLERSLAEKAPPPPNGCTMRFVTVADIETAAAQADAELHLPYVRDALARGDRCFGVFEGNRLLSYSWYSTSATGVTQELKFEFPRPHLYMHHAFTRPEARGRRLHAMSIQAALAALTQQSSADMLAIVSVANVASLKSCKRGGFAALGHFYLLGGFNRLLAISGRRCRRFGCNMTPRRDGFHFMALA